MCIDIIDLAITSMLTIIIIVVTIRLGVIQNKLQANSQNIELFEKRYEVYITFKDMVQDAETLSRIGIKDFDKPLRIPTTTFFKSLCLNKPGTVTNEKIRNLEKLKAKYQSIRIQSPEKLEIKSHIDILNNEIIYTSLSELRSRVTIIERSRFLFEEKISNIIIAFAKVYERFLELCVLEQKEFDDELNLLLKSYNEVLDNHILIELEEILSIYKNR